MAASNSNSEKGSPEASIPAWLETVRAQVASLRFGQVQIVVHDSQVVQIERIEKFRMDPKPRRSDLGSV